MNKKGFSKTIFLIIIILLGTVGYFALIKKQEPTNQQIDTKSSAPTQTSSTVSEENEAIAILSPNGGEKLIKGQEYLIKWKTNLPKSAPIHISFRQNSSLSKDVYKEFNLKTANSQYEEFNDSIYPNLVSNIGNYVYKIPNDISSGNNWQVMIWSGQSCSVWNQEKKCNFDLSDNFFSIQ